MSDEQYNNFEFGYDRNAVLHEVLSGERKEYGGYFDGPKEDIPAQIKGYKWWKRKFDIVVPALAAIVYRAEFLPEPKEETRRLTHFQDTSLTKGLRSENENRCKA